MKKLILVLSVAGMLTFSSCNKCQTCTNQGVSTGEFCQKDYPGGKKAYNDAIKEFEDAGWTCK